MHIRVRIAATPAHSSRADRRVCGSAGSAGRRHPSGPPAPLGIGFKRDHQRVVRGRGLDRSGHAPGSTDRRSASAPVRRRGVDRAERPPRLPDRRRPSARSPPASRSSFTRGTRHSYWNATSEPARYLLVMTPRIHCADRGAPLRRADRLGADLRGARLRAARGGPPVDDAFEPPDATVAPRYTGVRTFARLPHVELPRDDVDAAVIGVPFDTATSFRSGARFGPEAIRSASTLLRPYHPVLDDRRVRHAVARRRRRPGVTPGNALRTTEQIDAGSAPAARGRDRAARPRRRSLDRARRAARSARHPRPGGAGAARRPRRHLGSVLRRALLPRDAVPPRRRGGADRSGALGARRDARPAVRAGGHGRPARARVRGHRRAPTWWR